MFFWSFANIHKKGFVMNPNNFSIMKRYILSAILALISIFNSDKISAQCQSCFVATIDPQSPYNVNVDASCSTPSVYNYEWIVDGQSYISFPLPYMQIPFYTFGNHTITLVVYDAGCVDSSTQILTLAPNCQAAFSYTVASNLVYFSNSFSSPYSVYTYDFGDGTTGIGASPYHNYPTPGTYMVTCITNDSINNCTDTSSSVVTVTGNPTTCQANLLVYTDPISGFLYAYATSSVYDQFSTFFNFYLNGVLQTTTQTAYYSGFLPSAGTYTVTVVLTDIFGNNPCDTATQVINYLGPNNGGCYACFSSWNNMTGDSIYVDASCAYLPTGGSMEWVINGIPSSNNSSSQLLGFPTLGYQTIGLFIKDSSGNVCDSNYQYFYTYVIVPPCNSCLVISQVGGSTSDYIFDATCANSNASFYYFSVNNNYIASSLNPVFNYSFTQSGTYDICVQSSDSFGTVCNQVCQTIVVNTPTVTNFTLAGTIFKYDNNTFAQVPTTANEAKVYLIKLGTGGILNAIDSTTTNAFGQYAFTNKPIDDYRIKAALEVTSPDYSFNVPTYYQSGNMWFDAQVITLFGNSYNRDFVFNFGYNTGGNGFIGGNVYAGANKPTRTASATEVTLILMDVSTNKPAAYTKPDINGNYSFLNIADGTYKIYGELLNRASIPENIVIGATTQTHTNKNFVFTDNVIQPTSAPASVDNVSLKSDLVMFPNPATNEFTIINTNDACTLKIMDMVGKVMTSFELKSNERKSINVTQWTKGIYVVQEESKGTVKSNKIVVQ